MTDIKGKTVVVTGGAGFVGSHIADSFVDSCSVRVFDDLSSGTRSNVPDDATLFEGDIRDKRAVNEALEGADIVFHQAGLVSVPDSLDRPLDNHGINGTGTLNVLEAARRNDSRVVAASSAAVYGHPESVPVAEDAPKTPLSPYGVEKLALDQYTRLYHREYGLSTVSLRYFNIYGPRQQGGPYSGVITTFLEQATNGGPITVEGDGKQTRDFVYVDDVVRANRLAATTDATGHAFNVGTGESVTIRQLAESVRRAVGVDVDVIHVDPRPGDIRHSRADIGRAREQLGYEPSVALSTGLDRLV